MTDLISIACTAGKETCNRKVGIVSDLPEQWVLYERLQGALSRRLVVDDVAWGLEAGLRRALNSDATPEEVSRAVESESRKERHHDQLRRMHLPTETDVCDPDAAIDARKQLDQIRAGVTLDDWDLLCDVADGEDYWTVAAGRKATPGALRVRVCRLRRAAQDLFGTAG